MEEIVQKTCFHKKKKSCSMIDGIFLNFL